MLWAPVSELYGRRWSLLPAIFGLGAFSVGTAVSKNAQSVFLTRFFAGVFGSGPVSNVAAAMGDIWPPKVRGIAVSFYAIAVVGGPTLGPVIGGAVTQSYLGWRWTECIEAFFVFFIFALALFLLPETYEPAILAKKAKKLRKKKGFEDVYHPHEHLSITFNEILTVHLSRPVRMLFTQPIVCFLAFYASFVYALLYLTLEIYPIVFQEERGWSLVVGGLPFLGIFVGVLCATCINLSFAKRQARLVSQNGGKPVAEGRVPPMIVGAILFPIGLFWFGWTANPSISWVAPVFASGFIGAGFNTIFQNCILILVDTYGLYAASAVSANTLLRSILAAGFPMFARPMFLGLGVGPAMSILGGIACVAIPVPIVFLKYGHALKQRSTYSTDALEAKKNEGNPARI